MVASTDKTKKPKQPAKNVAAKPTVTKAAAKKATKDSAKNPAKKTKIKKQRDNYFVGAWHELKQVRWPDRKSTWGMTLGVIFYSLFFFVLIIVLDAIFKYLFDFIVKG